MIKIFVIDHLRDRQTPSIHSFDPRAFADTLAMVHEQHWQSHKRQSKKS